MHMKDRKTRPHKAKRQTLSFHARKTQQLQQD